ncbi:hypothetical protein BH11PSE2_BH11PSE2_22560 [soil metagenome]
MIGRTTLSLALVLMAGAALAQPPAPAAPAAPARAGVITPVPARRGPSMALSLEAVQKIVETCAAGGIKVSAIVVDSGGFGKAQLTADGADPRSVDFVARKAYTAALTKMTPGEAVAKARTDPAMDEMFKADQRLLRAAAGGFPIKVGDEVIGGIAASGAPTPAGDDVCAKAGLDAIQSRVK